MGKVRYIGSKARLRQEILDVIGVPRDDCGVFVDLFSGTGAVSQEAALRGWNVKANDHLLSSAIMTTAQLLSSEDVPFLEVGGYLEAQRLLNVSTPVKGFIYSEYTPEGTADSEHERRYFTAVNGMKIDGIRGQIGRWANQKIITKMEERLLIADLLNSANAVANIAGTYGCFMQSWQPSTLSQIRLVPRNLLSKKVAFDVDSTDAFQYATLERDTVYADPPYTKRQYAAYYHVLETIAHGDRPTVIGKTGLRPWHAKSSVFCYKMKAADALHTLISGLNASRVFLSYSSEGHINLDDAKSILDSFGATRVHQISTIGRYRPNKTARDAGATVKEYLFELERH